MKLTNLFVSNFLGARAIDIALDAPVQLFAGINGAGKSSLRDAVALALTGDLSRISLKKEAGSLIHSGADAATCEVQTADGQAHCVTITAAGKLSEPKRVVDPVLQYVLAAQRFAQMDDKERRAFLFGLMKLKTDGKAVQTRLLARGCDAAKVERIAPMLRSGFDAASKDAKAKATEAKGAWRAVTGETYGSEKGKTWRAAVPAHDAAAAKKLATEIQHADVAIGSWQQQVGKVAAEEIRRAELRAKLPAQQEVASRADRVQKKLEVDEAELTRLDDEITKANAAAGIGPRVGLVHDLAAALHGVTESPHAMGYVERPEEVRQALAAYEREHGTLGATTGDPDAAARLPALRKAQTTCISAVSNDRRDLEACATAKAEVERITAELAVAFDAGGAEEARKQVDLLKQQRAATQAKLDIQNSIKAQAEAAEQKTKDATAHHADVAAWDAIGDALAPDGIPGEMLAEALGPVNQRLAQSAADTGWLAAAVAPEMAITGAGREYRLLSESEQYRVDAMLAEAIAHLSGARLLVLDRFDVLDPTGRAQLIGWLDVLAENNELDTALVFGTLKACPTGLPATVSAHWIENGVLAQLKAAA
jgi:hypothetical protein